MTEKKDQSDLAVAEVGSLGRELARVYHGAVETAQRLRGLPFQEAGSELRKVMSSMTADCLRARDPKEISWADLTSLAGSGESLDVWERIKDAARGEEVLGLSAARTIEGYMATPWERATFLALRSGIVDEWKPRGGLELALIDTLATSLYMYRFWLSQHVERATTRAEIETSDLAERGRRRLPFDWEEDGTTQAAEMADRFHRMAMRTLRSLRDLRRYAPAVSIQSAGQVNIGEKQVNLGRA